jgi:hypothetical protein
MSSAHLLARKYRVSGETKDIAKFARVIEIQAIKTVANEIEAIYGIKELIVVWRIRKMAKDMEKKS